LINAILIAMAAGFGAGIAFWLLTALLKRAVGEAVGRGLNW